MHANISFIDVNARLRMEVHTGTTALFASGFERELGWEPSGIGAVILTVGVSLLTTRPDTAERAATITKAWACISKGAGLGVEWVHPEGTRHISHESVLVVRAF